jgi:hypothetical protein
LIFFFSSFQTWAKRQIKRSPLIATKMMASQKLEADADAKTKADKGKAASLLRGGMLSKAGTTESPEPVAHDAV